MEDEDGPKLEWEKVDAVGEIPAARSGHSLTALGNTAYLFGGLSKSRPPAPNNELFLLRMSTASFIWSRVKNISGEAPSPRWDHTATLFNDNQFLFFGGRVSRTNQNNETWVLDVMGEKWVCLSGTRPYQIGDNPRYQIPHVFPDTPPPRAGHSASNVKDQIFVFGGFGGFAYTREEMNDLFMFDARKEVGDKQWHAIIADGTAPTARSGHSCTVVAESKLFIFGGWNKSRQFNDLNIYDTTSNRWSNPNCNFGPSRWNHSSVAVESIPDAKMFIFGGSVGVPNSNDALEGDYSNDLLILDTGPHKDWHIPTIAGPIPAPRASSCLAFDVKGSRLMFFGGWANHWLDDMYVLDVGNIVGPPYAVTAVTPNEGPITGGGIVYIDGIDFDNRPPIVCRFATREFAVDVDGEFVSPTTLKCRVPDFSMAPGSNGQAAGTAAVVQVRVSLRNDSFTTTFQNYSYFAVTDANNCVAFGPALTHGARAKIPANFAIAALDTNGKQRTTGGDAFEVTASYEDDTTAGEGIPTTIRDNENGTYAVKVVPARSGLIKIDVRFAGSFGGVAGQLRGFPATMKYIDAVSLQSIEDKNNNRISGELHIEQLKSQIQEALQLATNTYEGLQLEVARNDLETLITVKLHIEATKLRDAEMQLFAQRTAAELKYLDELAPADVVPGVNVNKIQMRHDAAEAHEIWEKAKRSVDATEKRIRPMVKLQKVHLKMEMAVFEESCVEYLKNEHQCASFWLYETGGQQAKDLVKEATDHHQAKMAEFEKILHQATVFEFPELLTEAGRVLKTIGDNLKYAVDLWDFIDSFEDYMSSIRQQGWKSTNLEDVEAQSHKFNDTVFNMPEGVRFSGAFQTIEKATRELLSTCPLMSSLQSEFMRERHWDELGVKLQQPVPNPLRQERENMQRAASGFEVGDDQEMPLSAVLQLGLHAHVDVVEQIVEAAMKENKMEAALERMSRFWDTLEFKVERHRGTDQPIMRLREQDFDTLENDQITIQGMLMSRFVGHFEPEVLAWKEKLARMSEVLRLVHTILENWIYLEPLFMNSQEVAKELPVDCKRFKKQDAVIKDLVNFCIRTRVVAKCTESPDLLERLLDVSREIDLCKKALVAFLEGKRKKFSRFYFVSEAVLLDILSSSSEPDKLAAHIPKIFPATKELVVSVTEAAGSTSIVATGWRSVNGDETCTMDQNVELNGRVESYFEQILGQQVQTLQSNLASTIARYPKMQRTKWLLETDGDGHAVTFAQNAVLAAAIWHVASTEKSFFEIHAKGPTANPEAMKQYAEKLRSQISDLVATTRQSQLGNNPRARVMSMITMDVHYRDVFQRLLEDGVDSADSFAWQSQLRTYYEGVGSELPTAGASETSGQAVPSLTIRICDAEFGYGYEYLGNTTRLVVTPLTDKIYVTVTQALQLNMGSALSGPAGTGKTETTKDLAAALGKLCFVFNCSPDMDHHTMAYLFRGLAAAGAWGCFDEFNRLTTSVLSVCTVQFRSLCDAIRTQSETISLGGQKVSLDLTTGCVITMNPGYAGRSELPSGLKMLFRPINVVRPDLVPICENMLMAEGFEQAKDLASKIFCFYSNLAEFTSRQRHYDWSLRSVKIVLLAAGSLMRREPDLEEEAIIMATLRAMNVSKIVAADEYIFNTVIEALFPGVEPPSALDEDLDRRVNDAILQRNLWPDPQFLRQVQQLHDTLLHRHSVFILGHAGCGKSECWKVLARALALEYENVANLNPKVFGTDQLYGNVVPSTREWKDGVLSHTLRDLAERPGDAPKWLIMDGDLDANWIESMNSLMDDNKLLTLANNDRISMPPCMRLIFETADIQHASPATVSRAGVLWIETVSGSNWKNVLAAWIRDQTRHDHVKEALHQLCDEFIPSTLRWICGGGAPKSTGALSVVAPGSSHSACTSVALQAIGLVQSFLKVFGGMMTDQNCAGGTAAEVANSLRNTFAFVIVWTFGGCLADSSGGNGGSGSGGAMDKDSAKDRGKARFDVWFRKEFQGLVAFPPRDTVHDYWLDPESNSFENWKVSPGFHSVDFDSGSQAMQTVTVPTPEICALRYWVARTLAVNRHCMLVGKSGVGKSQVFKSLVEDLDPVTRSAIHLNFNFFTKSQMVMDRVESRLEKKSPNRYGPPGSPLMGVVLFVDDLNMPEADKFGTQRVLELMRQHIDYGYWHDPDKMAQHIITGCQYICALNPRVGSGELNPRMQRHFTALAVDFPSPTSLVTIFQTFLDGHLKRFKPEIQALSPAVINASISMHSSVVVTFHRTVKKFHYEFNLRHIARLFQGLLMADPTTIVTPAKLAMLWLHETFRVYSDCLVDESDQHLCRSLLVQIVKRRFPQFSLSGFVADKEHGADFLVFCHFPKSLHKRAYDKVDDPSELQSIVNEALDDYNSMNFAMPLVLFDDAVAHVCRITRLISNPFSHGLLVGVGGSGKQSLVRLSAHICNTTLVQMGTRVSAADFVDLLKELTIKAGVNGNGTVFLLTDSQVFDEEFFVPLNEWLATGHTPPSFFTVEERDTIVHNIRNRAKLVLKISDPTNEICWNFFQTEVARNFHFIFSFSPLHAAYRRWAQQFPAIFKCTVMNFFQPWPKVAMVQVARKFLSDVDADIFDNEEVHEAMVQFMPFCMQAYGEVATLCARNERRICYATPKSFLEFLKLFKHLLGTTTTKLRANENRLATGVQRLRKAGQDAKDISESMESLVAEAETSKGRAEEIAAIIARDKDKVEKSTARATREHDLCLRINEDVQRKKAQCEAELIKAEPAIIRAMDALNTINKKDLGMCKTMAQPPAGVDHVFSAVLALFANVYVHDEVQKDGRIRDKSWHQAKKLLLKNLGTFMQNLTDFKAAVDTDSVPTVNWKEVRPYLNMEHFNREVIEKRNSAAGGLCAWVRNIVSYYDILLATQPLRVALDTANEAMNEANAKLQAATEEAETLKAELDLLSDQFNTAEAERLSAIRQLETGKLKLGLAQRLDASLRDENVRWTSSMRAFAESQKTVVGDVLLASAFVALAGPFSKTYRDELVKKHWVPFLRRFQVPLADTPDPLDVLATPVETLTWIAETLPDDQVSLENGAIVLKSTKWPLLVDPQLQASHWLKARFNGVKHPAIQVLHQLDPTFIQQLSDAVESGNTVLVESIGDTLVPEIMPLVQRAIKIKGKGGNHYVRIGGQEVVFSPKFQLFLHTKISNPHFPPEVYADCSIVNFTLTEGGLQEQLLALVMKEELPDLADRRAQLTFQQNAFRVQIKEFEDEILEKLTAAKSDIIMDEALISQLESTKTLSNDLTEKSNEIEVASKAIQDFCEQYRPVASRGSLLFFLMLELQKVDPNYVYSLNAFVSIFVHAIAVAPKFEGAAKFGGSGKGSKQRSNSSKSGVGMTARTLGGGSGSTLMRRFRSAVSKVICANRFRWNVDLLRNSRIPHSHLNGDPGDGALESSKSGNLSAKLRSIDDAFRRKIHDRCKNLLERISLSCFQYLNRSVFGEHKLMLATLFTFKSLQQSGEMSVELALALLNMGATGIADSTPTAGNSGTAAGSAVNAVKRNNDGTRPPMHVEDWMTPTSWAKVVQLQSVFELQRLPVDISSDADLWADWFHVMQPEEEPLPAPYENLGPASVERLAITRALRPDRIPALLRKFVTLRMGAEYVSEEYHQIEDVLATSSSSTPICFFVTPGSEPLKTVEEVAAGQGFTVMAGSFVNISMGQGQEEGAEQALRFCAQKGFWVALQNVHLMTEWHATLEQLLETLVSTCHQNFRCFLTVERLPGDRRDTALLPEGMLQSCTKVTCGVVSGLQANVKRAWERIEMKSHEAAEARCLPRSVPALRTCLAALCFYHAVVVTRGRFGSSGWSDNRYDFNESDLDISRQVIYNYLAGAAGGSQKPPATVSWEMLRYTVGEIMYGGHMTDLWDRRLNAVYLAGMLQSTVVDGAEILPGIVFPPGKGGLHAFEKVVRMAQPGRPGASNDLGTDGVDDAPSGGDGPVVSGILAEDLDSRPATPAASALDEAASSSGTPRRPGTSRSTRSSRSARSGSSKGSRRRRQAPRRVDSHPEKNALRWESPELYGLHDNADLLSLRSQESRIFSYAKSLLRRSFMDTSNPSGIEGAGPVDTGHGGGGAETNRQGEDERQDGALSPNNNRYPASDDEDEEDGNVSAMPSGPVDDSMTRDDAEAVKSAVLKMKNRLPPLLSCDSEAPDFKAMREDPERAPFLSIMQQECQRMDALLRDMTATLGQLKLALAGKLAMSDDLHAAFADILVNRVPSTFLLAWASTKSLGPWFEELMARHRQLRDWLSDLERPVSIWLPGMFNPAALLVAMVQVASQRLQVSLNELTIETHVTQLASVHEAVSAGADVRGSSFEGVLFHGLTLQGARWAEAGEVTNEYHVDGAPEGLRCGGSLRKSLPKQLEVSLPLIYARAVQVEPNWTAVGISYLRNDSAVYDCPVYMTRQRGATFSFAINIPLDSVAGEAKDWIKAGVSAILESHSLAQ